MKKNKKKNNRKIIQINYLNNKEINKVLYIKTIKIEMINY